MAVRRDLVLEVDTTLDGSGNYASDWLDSSAIYDVRVLHWFSGSPSPTVQIDESSDQTHILTSTVLGADASLTARYFRLSANGGGVGATFRAAVRVTNPAS